MKTPLAKIGIWAAGWVVAGGLVSRVEPLRYEGSRARDEQGREQRNHSALAAMLGEFRTSASDLMFIQTERYLHGGISFRKGTAHAIMTNMSMSTTRNAIMTTSTMPHAVAKGRKRRSRGKKKISADGLVICIEK